MLYGSLELSVEGHLMPAPLVPVFPELVDIADDLGGELCPHGGIINMGVYGGTAEAGMSPGSEMGNTASADYRGVDGLDFPRVAGKWMADTPLLAEDPDRNGRADLADVLLVGQNRLWRAGD